MGYIPSAPNPFIELLRAGLLYGTITGILPVVAIVLAWNMLKWIFKGGEWVVKARHQKFSWNPMRYAALVYTIILFAAMGWGGFKLYTWIKETL